MGFENFSSYGTFSPMAYAAYQQYLQGQQQQQQSQNVSPLAGNGFSLVTPEAQQVQIQQTAGNFNGGFNNLGFGGNLFPQYNNDIFASQLLQAKPWENFAAQGQTVPQGNTPETPQNKNLKGVTFTI